MGLIKSIVRRRRKFAQARSLRAAGLPYLFRDTSFPVAERELERRCRDGGAEMFSVDCSLHRRKFALSFSLWSRALNPFLLQIQSPLLREVLPFIVNPRFFIARTETILHGQWKMIFENRRAECSLLCEKLRRGTSYPKARALRSLIQRVSKIKC